MQELTAFRAAIQPAADLLVADVRGAYAQFTNTIDAALIQAGVETMTQADQEAFSAVILEITTTAAHQIEGEG